MKTLALALVAALAIPALADNKPAAPNPAAATATKEIEKAFGFVPNFVRVFPQYALGAWWETTKTFELNPATALDNKTKELIGIAVAAQIPCEYCIYFHSEAARLNGASEAEIGEAVTMAAATRSGSTVLNGMQVDKQQFKKDIERIVKGARQAKK